NGFGLPVGLLKGFGLLDGNPVTDDFGCHIGCSFPRRRAIVWRGVFVVKVNTFAQERNGISLYLILPDSYLSPSVRTVQDMMKTETACTITVNGRWFFYPCFRVYVISSIFVSLPPRCAPYMSKLWVLLSTIFQTARCVMRPPPGSGCDPLSVMVLPS